MNDSMASLAVSPPLTLADFLQAERQRRGWGVREFAAAAGLDHSTLSRLLRGTGPTPTLDTLVNLSRTLNVSVVVLLKLALPDVPGVEASADTLVMAERFQQLTPDQRAVVDALLRGLLFP